MSALRPDRIVGRFLDIDFEALGRPYLILDVDNTIAPCKVTEDLVPGVVEHLRRARKGGVLRDICLVSNVFVGRQKAARVARFAALLDAHHVLPGILRLKPHPAPFREALRRMGAAASQAVVVGDQLFTDVLGGNRLDMLTVYVHPLGPDHWTTWLTMRRFRERRLLARWT
jgi:HAD superfamily phosphatase (TIGR01668 family)